MANVAKIVRKRLLLKQSKSFIFLKLCFLFFLFSGNVLGSNNEKTLFYQNFEDNPTAKLTNKTRGTASGGLHFKNSFDGRGLVVGTWDNTLHNITYAAKNNLNYQQGSVELWIKPMDWNGRDMKFHHFFAAQGKNITMIIYKYTNSDLYFLFGPKQKSAKGRVPWTVCGLNISHWRSNEWHHLICTWDKKEIQLVIDGERVAKPIATFPDTPFDAFSVGALTKWANTDGKTLVDNLKIYQHALNTGEINMLCRPQQNKKNKTVTPRPINPDAFWVLENDSVKFFIDKKHGNLASGWNLADQEEYITDSFDNYIIKKGALDKEIAVSEKQDTFEFLLNDQTKAENNPKIISVICKNSVCGLKIIKTYELWNKERKLIKKVDFSIDNSDKLLLKYAGVLNFNHDLRKDSYYHVRNERDSYAPFLVKASDVKHQRKVDNLRGMSQICLVNLKKKYGVGQYKYLINNRYDLKYGLGTSYYTPTGWIIAVGGDFIGKDKKFSAEVHYTIFPGDHVQFHLDYMNLPAYRKANDYQTPDWLKDVRFVAGWNEVHEIGVRISPEDFMKIFEKDEPLFGYVLSPWDDPMWENYGDFLDGELELYPKVGLGRIKRFKSVKAICPQLRLSCYTWHYAVGPKSKIFLNHPEWLVYNENDKPQCLADFVAYKLNSIFRQRICEPEYIRYACDRVKRLLVKLGYDTYYTDDISISRVSVDWRTKTVIHNYHWINYWKKIRETVKSVDKDKVYLANAYPPDIIGPDCGLLEAGGALIDPKKSAKRGRKRWTAIADRFFMAKLYQPGESRWVAPVFWGHKGIKTIRNNDPYYSNYLIGLGMKPMSAGEADAEFMGSTFNSLLSKLPYIDAAYETRGVRIVNTDILPCWWRDDGNIEAYTLRQGNAFLIPVISHERKNTQVRLTFSSEKAGLDKNSETYFWVFDMEDPWQFSKAEMLSPDWRQKSIMLKRFLKKQKKLGDKIDIPLTVRPKLLSLVLVTQVPALIYAVNERKSQILLPSTVDIDINGKLDYGSKKLQLTINSRKDTAEVIAYFPKAWGEPQIFSEG
ncbi:MAG: LamG-like jellyroll fold domain-containing protein, partial [Victivallaceae bacterium]